MFIIARLRKALTSHGGDVIQFAGCAVARFMH